MTTLWYYAVKFRETSKFGLILQLCYFDKIRGAIMVIIMTRRKGFGMIMVILVVNRKHTAVSVLKCDLCCSK